MRQATRHFEWLLAVAMLASGSICSSATPQSAPVAVEVSIRFPGDARTAAGVYAREINTGALVTGRVEAGVPSLILKLPPGRYWLFAEPEDPGAPDLLGAYTQWSLCQAKPRTDPTAACESHELAELVIERRAPVGASVDDWYLPKQILRQLDEALHRNPDRPDDLELGAPRFSEYPVRLPALAGAFRFDPDSHPEGRQWEPAVSGAAAHGVNFAGHWLVVTDPCGEHCANYAIIEWSSGRIFVPDALRSVSSALPCERAQAVQHRSDSRLLTVTQPDDSSVVTRYYLWDESKGALTEIASYRSSAQRYCGRD